MSLVDAGLPPDWVAHVQQEAYQAGFPAPPDGQAGSLAAVYNAAWTARSNDAMVRNLRAAEVRVCTRGGSARLRMWARTRARTLARGMQIHQRPPRRTCSLQSHIPWDVLRGALRRAAAHPEAWLAARERYTSSLAATSAWGYLVGLGDRHLANLLVVTRSGGVLPIDFGYAFSTAVMVSGAADGRRPAAERAVLVDAAADVPVGLWQHACMHLSLAACRWCRPCPWCSCKHHSALLTRLAAATAPITTTAPRRCQWQSCRPSA